MTGDARAAVERLRDDSGHTYERLDEVWDDVRTLLAEHDRLAAEVERWRGMQGAAVRRWTAALDERDDAVQQMLAGADERRQRPAAADDPDELHDRLAAADPVAVVAGVDLEGVLAATDEAITATVHVASEAEEAKAAVRAALTEALGRPGT